MTAIFVMLKSFFVSLLPTSLSAATGAIADPLKTIKSILTLLIVLVVVCGVGYYGYTKYKDNRSNEQQVKATMANTANNNASIATVMKDSGSIDTKTVAENSEQKQKVINDTESLDKEHTALVNQLKREDSLKTKPNRFVAVMPVKKPSKKETTTTAIDTSTPVTIVVPEDESVRSKKLAAANIAYMWKSYCLAVSESDDPCPS